MFGCYRGLAEQNRRNPHTKFVVVLQMHHSRASITEDLILATRSLAREVQVRNLSC